MPPRAIRRSTCSGGQAVSGQIDPPLLAHGGEESRAYLVRPQPYKSHRMCVVRGWCGQGFGNRLRDQLWVNRPVAESANRMPQQLSLTATLCQRLGGAEPEQVLVAGTQQIGRT